MQANKLLELCSRDKKREREWDYIHQSIGDGNLCGTSRHTSTPSRTCSFKGRRSRCSIRQVHRVSGASLATKASWKRGTTKYRTTTRNNATKCNRHLGTGYMLSTVYTGQEIQDMLWLQLVKFWRIGFGRGQAWRTKPICREWCHHWLRPLTSSMSACEQQCMHGTLTWLQHSSS